MRIVFSFFQISFVSAYVNAYEVGNDSSTMTRQLSILVWKHEMSTSSSFLCSLLFCYSSTLVATTAWSSLNYCCQLRMGKRWYERFTIFDFYWTYFDWWTISSFVYWWFLKIVCSEIHSVCFISTLELQASFWAFEPADFIRCNKIFDKSNYKIWHEMNRILSMILCFDDCWYYI